jgi:hypothetical protein
MPVNRFQRRRPTVHTVRRLGVWTNQVEGAEGIADQGTGSRHRTKDEASEAGREIAIALGADHVIHNFDGSIGSRSRKPELPQTLRPWM